ncbi:SubName: Full=Uncharacterized protein {ECO:0000313/EMBL:CCA68547.1} [Serendipita indica DSM 11827]|uniref:Uncharacterized protein n=1 Tax=Serendipita indica (strain DSM 11827) TaxID=1109443 RepID=G4TB46_SERID|nr:SubName: Full=Uncharacterized protein {ECO:0000313/EMBL:CCA68547.1} [Serendipita indica DSM 11827]CCA68547.1 hypothetical protein PIIN_02410 [Serendipita indica DSM 11827]
MKLALTFLLAPGVAVSAVVVTCQTTATICTTQTANEAVANAQLYLDNFGQQPAGADFYLWTGIISGSSNLGTCGVQLRSDAYHPSSVQANITKNVWNIARISAINSCIVQGKQANVAFDDVKRFEGPTIWFWK